LAFCKDVPAFFCSAAVRSVALLDSYLTSASMVGYVHFPGDSKDAGTFHRR